MSHSDAIVFFGAAGDLAYNQIFPALQAPVERHILDIPIIGVAKARWTLDQLRARARQSVAQHCGVDEVAFGKLSALLQRRITVWKTRSEQHLVRERRL